MMSSSKIWGIASHESRLEFPCDAFKESFHDTYYRGVSVHARPEIIFQWICQMRIAPYSYDWIDNFGRKSPQRLIPEPDPLENGQTIMSIFELISFEKNRYLTLRLHKKIPKFFGNTFISYGIFPEGTDHCRLLVKILVQYPKGFPSILLDRLVAVGDLIMMRRQLLNFKKLSERTQKNKRREAR